MPLCLGKKPIEIICVVNDTATDLGILRREPRQSPLIERGFTDA
jgi:hypothetical protein